MDEVMHIENSGMDSAVRQIGDSWSLLIVWSALQGTTRFDNFQSRLGVARNILSKRLSKLVDEGIFVKRPVHSGARRLEYRMTDKGEALRPALELIEGWGNGASVDDTSSPAQGTERSVVTLKPRLGEETCVVWRGLR
jgi:DNA-binding HxlR family transcriptional regulator